MEINGSNLIKTELLKLAVKARKATEKRRSFRAVAREQQKQNEVEEEEEEAQKKNKNKKEHKNKNKNKHTEQAESSPSTGMQQAAPTPAPAPAPTPAPTPAAAAAAQLDASTALEEPTADFSKLLAAFATAIGYGARFSTEITLEDAIGSHACSLEASRRVTNVIPLGRPLFLPVHTVNCFQTLKDRGSGRKWWR